MTMRPNYEPPFPSYCARFPTQMDNLVIAIIGAQYSSPSRNHSAGISSVKSFMTATPEKFRPMFWEIMSVTDKRGAFNIAVIAYWSSVAIFKDWKSQSGFASWWETPEREEEGHGWFQEVLEPTMDRIETIFSDDGQPEGAAHMQESMSGQLQEHGYWGSVRDRLPVAQDSPIEGEKWIPRNEETNSSGEANGHKSKRVRIPAKENLCIIRSGQDWSSTLPEERKLYLETMHPVLIEGMNFLRDSGGEIGCYANDLWDVVDSENYEANLERTFGLGFFDDLKSLEHWSKSHKTHIKIFAGFHKYAKKLNNVLSLRLFHEICILKADQQFFEYIGCHEETGLLNALRV